MHVSVIGAGPAGSSAALSALGEGASVTLYDKSRFPRHKVCGEFLSPEVAQLLDRLGVWSACEEERPSRLRSVFLSIGERTKAWKLDEPARGLSRYAMDRILLGASIRRGAEFRREVRKPVSCDVFAQGRHARAVRGDRLFGFKAHFSGPADESMSLYFFNEAYVGVNSIEGGLTNVCGLAPERVLQSCGFNTDTLLRRHNPLTERLSPMRRTMEWLTTGPLVFGPSSTPADCYGAGDASFFIDPFTGSGMLSAIATGILAGRAAAHRSPIDKHRHLTEEIVKGQHRAANLFRSAIIGGWAERLLPIVPGRILFYSTRPRAKLS